MSEKDLVQGVMTVTVTPFDAQGQVDYSAYERLLEHLFKKGVHAICPCGTTGEYFALSPKERCDIMEFVAGKAAERVTLFAGTGATTTAEVIGLTRTARDLGYAGVLLGAPPISRPTKSELSEFFREVFDAVGLPIILYNNPPRTGVDLDLDLIEDLLRIEGVVALKESCGSLTRLHTLMLEFGDRLEIACGADSQAVEFFLWGSRSWIAGPSNFLAPECVAIYEHCVERRDFETGTSLMRQVQPVIKVVEETGKFVQHCKFGCELAGIPVGATRSPLKALTPAERKRFKALYDRAVDGIGS